MEAKDIQLSEKLSTMDSKITNLTLYVSLVINQSKSIQSWKSGFLYRWIPNIQSFQINAIHTRFWTIQKENPLTSQFGMKTLVIKLAREIPVLIGKARIGIDLKNHLEPKCLRNLFQIIDVDFMSLDGSKGFSPWNSWRNERCWSLLQLFWKWLLLV